jgi:hypothetical protein
LGAFGSITVVEMRGEVEKKGLGCGLIGLVSVFTGTVGLVGGLLLAPGIIQAIGLNPVMEPIPQPTPTDVVSNSPTMTANPMVEETTAVESVPQPSPVHIMNGEYTALSKVWTWVCTGDFSTDMNGTKQAWYDLGVEDTGLVLVIPPDSNFTISGAFEIPDGMDVGDCLPYNQDEKEAAISSAVRTQIDRGCISGCQYVNVVELDKDANEIESYWTPQKP